MNEQVEARPGGRPGDHLLIGIVPNVSDELGGPAAVVGSGSLPSSGEIPSPVGRSLKLAPSPPSGLALGCF